nr:MAG TPA: hypothetical protein [Caudoviricetes sp.]
MVLDGRSVARDHLPDCPITFTGVGVQQHEHRAVAPRHRLELLECGIARGRNFAQILRRRSADIARVAIAHPSRQSFLVHNICYSFWNVIVAIVSSLRLGRARKRVLLSLRGVGYNYSILCSLLYDFRLFSSLSLRLRSNSALLSKTGQCSGGVSHLYACRMTMRLRSISTSLCSMMISSLPTFSSSFSTRPSSRVICSDWIATTFSVFANSAESASAFSLRFFALKKRIVPASPLARMKFRMMDSVSIVSHLFRNEFVNRPFAHDIEVAVDEE